MAIKIIKIICFFLTLIFPLLMVNEIYTNSSYYRSMNGLYKFENVPQNIQIANLGTSHGRHAFDYADQIDLVGFNFALPAQPLFYDFQIFETYVNNFSNNAILIIPISFFSLYATMEDRKSLQPIYYRLLDEKHIYNFSLKQAILYKYLPVLSAEEKLIEAIKDKSEPHDDTPNGTMEQSKLENDGNVKAKTFFNISHNQIIDELNRNTMNDIFYLCKQRNITPVLITTPFTKWCTKNFSKEYIEQFYKDIKEIAGDQILYLDYAFDQRFQDSPELFIDTDHLNADGRKIFTQIVIDDLTTHGLI